MTAAAEIGGIFMLCGALNIIAAGHARAMGAKDVSSMHILGFMWLAIGGIIIVAGAHS